MSAEQLSTTNSTNSGRAKDLKELQTHSVVIWSIYISLICICTIYSLICDIIYKLTFFIFMNQLENLFTSCWCCIFGHHFVVYVERVSICYSINGLREITKLLTTAAAIGLFKLCLAPGSSVPNDKSTKVAPSFAPGTSKVDWYRQCCAAKTMTASRWIDRWSWAQLIWFTIWEM